MTLSFCDLLDELDDLRNCEVVSILLVFHDEENDTTI